MRDALKARLEEAAEANQRSLSEEIETQLEAQLMLHDLMPTIGRRGDPGILRVMAMLSVAIEAAERETGKRWAEDEETLDKVLKLTVILASRLKQDRDKALAALMGAGEEKAPIQPEKDKDKGKQS
jgi:hypothetical protein